LSATKGSYSSLNKDFNKRASFLLATIYLVGLFTLVRLFTLGVSSHDFYTSKLEQQERLSFQSSLRRGEIYLQNSSGVFPAAINKNWPMAYAEPNRIVSTDLSALAERISTLLNIDKTEVLKKISNPNDPFELLKNQLSDEEAEAILGLGDSGIKIQEERIRHYPGEGLASHVLGFLGNKNNERIGQYGIEEYYNNHLSGNGSLSGDISLTSEQKDLILTVDSNIQLFVEEELEGLSDIYEASGGSIIVMDPKSGRILSMANYPDFNPNDYAENKDYTNFMNSSISSVFEPGSVFKPIIMAVALDQEVVTPASTYIDKGSVKIGGYTVYNADRKIFGLQTMTEVLEKSLNTGVVYVQSLLEHEVVKEYFKKFGLDKITGIDLPHETKGSMANLDAGREINFATASFGQGISMTPIQLVRAIGVLANGGKIVTPHVVETIVDDDNIQIEGAFEGAMGERIISEQATNRLVAMMVNVTEKGTGKNAKIPGYWVATKTGTAQIPSTTQRGYSDESIHTVVGFAPAYDPRFVILIKLDKPQKGRFAATTVAPAFRNISEYILNYLEIPPER